MESLVIEETKSTPSVHFDPHTHLLQINGQSYPENAFKFYEPVLAWAGQYLDSIDGTIQSILELNLPYINTSSTKCFMMLLEKLDEAYQSGKSISIRWYCNEDNESEYECAEEFKEDLTIPFDIIVKSGDA
jgi:hypothetical protein